MLTDAEIAALIGAVVVLANAFAIWLQNQSSAKRSATTQAQVAALHQAVSDVTGAAPPVLPPVPSALVDGHVIPPT